MEKTNNYATYDILLSMKNLLHSPLISNGGHIMSKWVKLAVFRYFYYMVFVVRTNRGVHSIFIHFGRQFT